MYLIIYDRIIDFLIFSKDFSEDNESGKHSSTIGLCLRHMRKYLSEIGEIISIHFWSNSFNFIRGVVQFQNKEHAEKVLQCTAKLYTYFGRIRVSRVPSNSIEPESFHVRHQFPIDSYSTDVDINRQSNNEAINILDLDDDCVQEIFDYLNVIDLSSVAEVCQHFKTSARKRFAIRHKSIHLLEIVSLDMDRMANFMENFGPAIEKLEISPRLLPNKNDFPGMLVQHFTSLEELSINYFNVDDTCMRELKPLCVHLKKLRLYKCQISKGFSEMFVHFSQLTKLKIVKSRFEEPPKWPPVRLPKLESLSIVGRYVPDRRKLNWDLEVFLECNPQLRRVELINYRGSGTEDRIIPTIATHSLIEKLKLSLVCEALSNQIPHLTQMNTLKTLKLNTNKCVESYKVARLFRELAVAKISLEHLELVCGIYDRSISAAISNLKSLKTLCLLIPYWGLLESDLLRICENLSDLTDLHVKSGAANWVRWNEIFLLSLLRTAKKLQRIRVEYSWVPITAEIYEKLLEIAKERATTKPLQIFISPYSMNEFKKCVPQSTLNTNKNVLAISPFLRKQMRLVEYTGQTITSMTI